MLKREIISLVKFLRKGGESVLDHDRLVRKGKRQLMKMTSGHNSVIGGPHIRLKAHVVNKTKHWKAVIRLDITRERGHQHLT